MSTVQDYLIKSLWVIIAAEKALLCRTLGSPRRPLSATTITRPITAGNSLVHRTCPPPPAAGHTIAWGIDHSLSLSPPIGHHHRHTPSTGQRLDDSYLAC